MRLHTIMQDYSNIPVLIVDDHPENLTAIEVVLEDLNLNLVKAHSGHAALSQVLHTDFALVLLDVQMPEMDGFETAELMRKNTKTSHIPILFLTAGAKESDHLFKGYEAGAVDYLTKPIVPLVLSSKVKIFCEIFKQRHELHRQKVQLEEDIRTQRRLKDQIVSQERLSALGTLTAGVAHEIKNPLNIILNSALLLRRFLENNLVPFIDELEKKTGGTRELGEVREELRESLELVDHIEKRSREADSTVKNMLLQARTGEPDLLAYDLNALVHDNFELSYHTHRVKFAIEVEIATQGRFENKLLVYPQELARLFLNIFDNAFYTVREKKNANPDFLPRLEITQTESESECVVTIRDNGMGIKPGLIGKIFDPFFTTKPTGEGTGLGLSMCADIIKLHEGRIEVTSEVGIGSAFAVYISKHLKKKHPDTKTTEYETKSR